MSIHPLASVHPTAEIGSNVEIGPFSVIEADTHIGDGCKLAARTNVKSAVSLGRDCMVEEGAVIGGRPQHLQRIENPGRVVIGDRNLIRENVTIHRAMKADAVTRIGSDCLLMVGSHVAHDCVVSDQVVLTNNVMLAGHVEIGSRAYIGGGAAVHQFCRIGRLAMVGGLARVTQDVPPFVMLDGGSSLVVGLNRVGLKRAGLTTSQISELKTAYQIVYRSGLSHDQRLTELTRMFANCPAAELGEFFLGGSRGFVRERRMPPGATLRAVHGSDRETKTIKSLAINSPQSIPLPIKKAG